MLISQEMSGNFESTQEVGGNPDFLNVSLFVCLCMFFLSLGAALFPFNAKGFWISCRRRNSVVHDLSTFSE